MSDVYVGLMSGTSLDGISAAVVRFDEKRPTFDAVDYELLAFRVSEYKPEQRHRMLAAMQKGTAEEYCRLGFDLGGWLADAAVAVMAEAGVPRSDIRAIGSHGQTLWHVPLHSTWQYATSNSFSSRTGSCIYFMTSACFVVLSFCSRCSMASRSRASDSR